MGCSTEAAEMSLHEYEQRLWHWNEAHDTEGSAPDYESTQALLDKINADPRLTH